MSISNVWLSVFENVNNEFQMFFRNDTKRI